MRRTSRDALASLLVAVAVVGGLYWIGGHASLAVVAGICWGFGLGVTLRTGHLYPAFATGERWTDQRWTGLSVGLTAMAALIGISPFLPMSAALRLEIGFLVVGVGLVSYAAGTMAVLERTEAVPSDPSSHHDVPSEDG
ncbi:MAG: hypothetical protein ACI9EZ_000059 [Halobacteriales archaeon]|jgi:hypothetical protein